MIEHELASYGGLDDRPRLVALNKIDVPDGREMAEIVRADLEARGLEVFAVSAASGEGLRQLTYAMAEIVRSARAARTQTADRADHAAAALGRRWRRLLGDRDLRPSLARTRAWRVTGPKPERWVRQTDFSNDEAVGFLADRLNRLGVESRLVQLGAVEGDAVLIGHPDNAVVFDFKPGIDAGVEMLGRRGEDQRFDEKRPATGPSSRDPGGDARARRDRDPRRRRPPDRPPRPAVR